MLRVEDNRGSVLPRVQSADFTLSEAGSTPVERILVVEDDRVVQKALKRLFEAERFSVEICADGQSALEAFRRTAPAAIVLDLRLPVLSGSDVCREIKRQSPAIPIIVLSAVSDVSDKVLLLEIGADDYVTKPFSPPELLARVRAALRRTARTGVGEVVTFEGIAVNFTKKEVMRDGPLKFLVQNAERVISRDALLNKVCLPRPSLPLHSHRTTKSAESWLQ